MFSDLFEKLKNNNNLSRDESKEFIDSVFTGSIPSKVLTEFLLLLNNKGFDSNELTGCALSMREASRKVIFNDEVIDNCGTGGDGLGTFNISTTASLVASSAGVRVAKHGNKAVTSSSGSADILHAAGININLSPKEVSLCLEKFNFGFMFAPLHHMSMKHVADSRKAIAPEKTIFNLLGPLTNPANAKKQLLGVYSKDLMLTMAETLVNLGTEKAMIVHSNDGLDEISIFNTTNVIEVNGSDIKEYTIDPEEYFNCCYSLSDIIVSDVTESLNVMKSVLNNETGPAKDIALINAGALMYISGKSVNLSEGIKICDDVIKSKDSIYQLEKLIKYTKTFKNAS